MEKRIKEIAQRIRGLRELMDITPEEMARETELSVEAYTELENGETDFSFSFIYKCAQIFGVDMTDILKGSSPTLTSYVITRKGDGLPITRRTGFSYLQKAPLFKGKIAEPFFVKAVYSKEAEQNEISLSHHDGQELDFIISGSLKVRIGENIEYLNEGDLIYYDSSQGHGMVAADGKDCEFLAIILKK